MKKTCSNPNACFKRVYYSFGHGKKTQLVMTPRRDSHCKKHGLPPNRVGNGEMKRDIVIECQYCTFANDEKTPRAMALERVFCNMDGKGKNSDDRGVFFLGKEGGAFVISMQSMN